MRAETRPAGAVTVAHVVQNLDVGGLERVVINLIEATNAEHFDPVLYTLGPGGALAAGVADCGHRVRALAKRPGRDYFLLPRIARGFRQDGVAIVHCHNYSPLVYGSLAGRLAAVAGVIYTAHGAKTAGRRTTRLFQRLGLVDDVVFVSDDARRVAALAGAIDERRVHTIQNGIDVDAYRRGPDVRRRIRGELGIAEDAPVAGIVARLTRAKDHVNLFDAFVRIQRARPLARCVVVGDGELRETLERAVAERGLGDAVLMLGRRDDVADVLSAFDVFVLSSSTEGLAVTLLEAMAAGLPVVATRVGGNPEVVVDGATGVIVPPRDPDALARALVGVFEDPAAARAMGERGRERALSRFGVAAMSERYESLYRALVARRRAA